MSTRHFELSEAEAQLVASLIWWVLDCDEQIVHRLAGKDRTEIARLAERIGGGR